MTNFILFQIELDLTESDKQNSIEGNILMKRSEPISGRHRKCAETHLGRTANSCIRTRFRDELSLASTAIGFKIPIRDKIKFLWVKIMKTCPKQIHQEEKLLCS